MNERIKLLAEQARKYADENRPGSFVKYDPEWFVLYNEKFAELLINECAETVQDFVDHRFPASEYPVRLRRYFGVSE